MWTELRSRWPVARAQVETILSQEPSPLNRNIYRQKSVPAKLAEIDAYLTPECPTAPAAEGSFLQKLTKEAIQKGTKAKGVAPEHEFFEACSRWETARQLLSTLKDDYLVFLRRRFVEVLRTQLGPKKEKLGIQFFDDLLSSVYAALSGPKRDALAARIRAQYRAALIDEFQDTDLIQYRIFSSIYSRTQLPLLLIGDPKQAIYAFRGADIFAYLAAVADSDRSPETLDVNWRSDPDLLRGVAQLFGRPRRPFLLDGVRLPPVKARPGAKPALTCHGVPVPPLHLRFLPSGETAEPAVPLSKTAAQAVIPAIVAADVARLLSGPHRIDDRPILPSDVAILVRSNDESARIQRELSRLGIPSVTSQASSVFESPEAGELALLLAALAEPSNGRLIRGALATPLFGLSASEIFELGRDESLWDSWVARFRAWHELWQRRGFGPVHRAILGAGPEFEKPAVSTRRLTELGGERSLTNHLHLGELLERAAHENHLGVFGLCRWFERARNGGLGRSESAELRLETDDPAMKLVTIHKSKGLEYPVVYCTSLWFPAERRPRSPRYDEPVVSFHDPSDAHRLKLDLRDSEDSRAHSAFEQRAESLRLSYVALTRAKHLCIVLTGNFESLADSALGYLLHHQDDESDPWTRTKLHIEGLDQSARWAETMAFAEASGGCISASREDEAPPPLYSGPSSTIAELSLSPRTRTITVGRAISSYSALVRGSAGSEPDSTPIFDRGEAEVVIEATPATVPLASALTEFIPLRDFPRTANAGSCFHAIFEEADFQANDGCEALIRLTKEKLRLYGYAPDAWSDIVAPALHQTLHTALSAGQNPIRLSEVPQSARLDELAFLISVRVKADFADRTPLNAKGLAEVFREHARESLPAEYAESLSRLEFPALRGFLKGYIDLVFERDGQFYVVDYKSNYLGPRFVDYRPGALIEAMAHGHYYLQYHLYALAVHRYLGRRVANYDYERHFGGVFYLFIKGMSEATGCESGVFFDRPARALVEALDGYFAGAPAEGAVR